MERSLKKKYWADQAKKSVLLIPGTGVTAGIFHYSYCSDGILFFYKYGSYRSSSAELSVYWS